MDTGSKKIALVTGSASGIGANIAVDLAATGEYFVIVTGRNAISIQRVVEKCNEAAPAAKADARNGCASPSSVCAYAFQADLCDYQQLDRLLDFVKGKFKRLDVLVNNACWRGHFASPLDAGDDSYLDFKKVMHLNVSVPMYIVHKCLIPLAKWRRPQITSSLTSHEQPSTGSVVIINISSIASQIVVPLHSYSISKACLSELSRQLAESARELGILSVTVSPGPVLTDERPHHEKMSKLTLMNRVGSTQEISDVVLHALKNAHLLNGKEINVDGGYTVRQLLSSNNNNQ